MTEAPLLFRALRLVSLALIVCSVALVATAGYSGMQEFQALSKTLSTSGSNNNPNSFTESFNGTELTLSGLVIPNNMTYPLQVQVLGTIELAGTTIGTFASPLEQIAPGQSKPLTIQAPVSLQKALTNQSVLEALLFNSSLLTLKTQIAANIVPLLGVNLSSSQSTSIPALLQGFHVTPQTPSNSSQGWALPLGISWTNPSPLGLNGAINVKVTSLPGYPGGSLPQASVPLNIVPNAQENLNPVLYFSNSQLQYLQPGSQIGLGITFSVFGANITLPETVTIP
jgi:hypothetical protein